MKYQCACLAFFMLIMLATGVFAPAAPAETARLSSAFPDLAQGILAEAKLETLPEGELLRAGDIVITKTMIDQQIAELPEEVRKQADMFLFHILESIAMEEILMREVFGEHRDETDEEKLQAVVTDYMLEVVGDIEVTDDEIETFYNENREMMPDISLEQLSSGIAGHLRQQKEETAWEEHIRGMGRRVPITLSEVWTTQQADRMKGNPVDRARASDKPVLVDFGADWCAVCRQLKPVIAAVEEKYGDQAAIVNIDVDEHQFLANRYGVSGIPLLIFFDKDGKEVFRHTGFMSEELIVERLKELGVS